MNTATAAPADRTAAKLAKDHSRFLRDARYYAAQGDTKAAARKTNAARKVEATLIEGGHRELVGELTELSHLFAAIAASVTERNDLQDRVCLTLDRIHGLTK